MRPSPRWPTPPRTTPRPRSTPPARCRASGPPIRRASGARSSARGFEAMTARADELALLMTLEMGKPLAESEAEVTYASEFLRWFAEEAVRIEGRFATVPNGVGAADHPAAAGRPLLRDHARGTSRWRWARARSARRSPPAARCVIKPAQQTPLSMYALAEILEEAGLPAGVLNVADLAAGPATSRRRSSPTRGCASSPSPARPRSGASWSPSPPTGCCAPRWSWAATPRSSSSRTPTSTPRSRARWWPRCATSARPAPPPTASTWPTGCATSSPRSWPASSPTCRWAAAPRRASRSAR